MRTVIYEPWYLAEKNRRPEPRHPRRQRINDHRESCPRRALQSAVAGGKSSLAGLSRMIGRPDHYLSGFVQDGQPKALREDEHSRLANFFGVDERGLGIRDLWMRS